MSAVTNAASSQERAPPQLLDTAYRGESGLRPRREGRGQTQVSSASSELHPDLLDLLLDSRRVRAPGSVVDGAASQMQRIALTFLVLDRTGRRQTMSSAQVSTATGTQGTTTPGKNSQRR